MTVKTAVLLKKMLIRLEDIFFFKEVNIVLISCRNFHGVRQNILTCITTLHIITFWELHTVKMFTHYLLIYLPSLLSIPIEISGSCSSQYEDNSLLEQCTTYSC
jgi:hypothetical protein